MNRPGRRWWKVALGYLFAAACLVWVFHDLRGEDLRRALGGLHWGWIPAAVACDIASYLSQGLRWRELLPAPRRLAPVRATQAIYAGLFVNEMLPMRPGELVRAYLASRWLRVDLPRIFPSILVERLLDSIWVALALAAAAAFVPLPAELVRAGDALGLLVLLGTGIYALLVLRGGRGPAGSDRMEPPEPSGIPYKVRLFLRHQAEGVREIGISGRLLLAFAFTGTLLILQGLAFWLVLRACRVPIPLGAGLVVFLIVHFGTAIPNAPGNIGSYQFFCVLGLSLFGVEKGAAASFSLVVFVILTVPLWVLGYAALHRAGFGLRSVREEISPTAMVPGINRGS